MTEYLPDYGEADVAGTDALRRGLAAARDSNRWTRFRWFGSAWIIAVGTMILGGGFTVAGDRLVNAKGVWAMYAHIPGGLHTHGVLMLAVSIPLLAGLSLPLFGYPEPREFLYRMLKLVCLYWLWSSILLFLAPAVPEGEFSYVGTTAWSMITLWTVLLSVSNPPELVSRTESEVVRAALAVGIPPEQARMLGSRFRGGDGEHTQ